jgi:hypothetical protein
MQFENLYGPWNDGDVDLTAVNNWFDSDTWINICDHGEQGDPDSLQMMEQVHMMLSSLIFHMKQTHNHDRTQYEIDLFNRLTQEYK